MAETKPLAEQYYDAVEELKAAGRSNADAIRDVAAKFNKTPNAVRGSLHQYKVRRGHGTSSRRRSRSQGASVDDLVNGARDSLERALKLVDAEVAEAKAALDSAQERYEQAVAEVKTKKADLERKLKAIA